MIEVKVKGIDQVNKMLGSLSDMQPYDDAMKELAIETMYLAKRYAPVSSGKYEPGGYKGGRLEQDIRYGRNGPADYYVMADPVDARGKHYAVYNEYGSLTTPAGTPDSPFQSISGSGKICFRPFLRPAAIQARRMAPSILARNLFGKL